MQGIPSHTNSGISQLFDSLRAANPALPSRGFSSLANSGAQSNATGVIAPQLSGGGYAAAGTGMDALDLSPGTTASLEYARVQFEFNYSSFRSINQATGVETQKIEYSLNLSVEYLQVTTGQSPDGFFTAAGQGDKAVSAMERMMEFFSPESTAGRILDFALSRFPLSSQFKDGGGDNETSRQNFANFIGGAIQDGFDQAMGTLGQLPDSIQEGVDKTHQIVFDGLQDFIQNGRSPEKTEPGGVYERIQTAQVEYSLQIDYQRQRTESTTTPTRAADGASDHNDDKQYDNADSSVGLA